MHFWPVFICDLLIPVIQVLGGLWMWKFPPKKINSFCGYRTARSMKNADTWKFAHVFGGRLWFIFGLATLPVYALLHLPFYGKDENTLAVLSIIIMAVQLAVLILSILPTEKALKTHFTEEGEIK
jgi:uncharacterized membrane protein